ncbi:MAG: hypothetical protein J7521_17175 [Caulobacter sp.]|nr:hypothetical protein [Caulobacter sp.]
MDYKTGKYLYEKGIEANKVGGRVADRLTIKASQVDAQAIFHKIGQTTTAAKSTRQAAWPGAYQAGDQPF